MNDIKLSSSSYLYASSNGDIEVVATGRYAYRSNAVKQYRIVEVTPIDGDWTKFVSEYLLSKIECDQ